MPPVPTHPDAQLVLTDHGLVLLAETHPGSASLTLTLIDAGQHEAISGACPLHSAPASPAPSRTERAPACTTSPPA